MSSLGVDKTADVGMEGRQPRGKPGSWCTRLSSSRCHTALHGRLGESDFKEMDTEPHMIHRPVLTTIAQTGSEQA